SGSRRRLSFTEAQSGQRATRPERRLMKRLLAIGCAVVAPFLYPNAQTPSAQTTTAAQTPAASPTPAPSPQRQLLDRYCVGCHNQRAKAAGQEAGRKLTLDDLDPAHISEHPDKWELVVRRLRAGMMPPANSRRPDKATYDGFITWLE